MISFTGKTVAAIVLAAVCELLSMWLLPGWVPAGVIGALVALVALDVIVTRPSFEIHREYPNNAELGAPLEVRLKVTHDFFRGLAIELEDTPPEPLEARSPAGAGIVPARGGLETAYDALPVRRGSHRFGETFIRYTCAMGFVRRKVVINNPDTINVFPSFDDFRKFQMYIRSPFFLSQGLKSSRLIAEGTVFESLREYRRDDDYRQIDWKATARMAAPISRNYEIEKNQNVVMMLDTGRLMGGEIEGITKLDYALRTALAAGLVCMSQGDNVGVLGFEREVSGFVPPGRGKRHMIRIMELLYGLEPGEVDPDYAGAVNYLLKRKMRRSLIIVFTDLTDAEASDSLVKYMCALHPRHERLCIVLKDSEVEELAGVVPASERDFFRKSIAMKMTEKRKLVFSTLRGKGVGVVEARPEDLSIAVVNKYLELKKTRFF